MEQSLAEVKRNHGDVAQHIVGLIVVDSHHLSEHQALAHAREFLAPRQPENVNAFWGLALIKPGNFVNKPMSKFPLTRRQA
jgi:hypothetical protein